MRRSNTSEIVVSLLDAPECVSTPEHVLRFTQHSAGAVFDSSRKYRYLLWRTWDTDLPMICFVMLNPSTADAFRTDPTIKRCINFATRWHFGSLHIVNLFSYRATEPQRLARARSPIGALNDHFLLSSVRASEKIILAWGNHGQLRDRATAVRQLLGRDDRLHHLGLTLNGQPKHPLYLSADSSPIRID